MMITYADHMSYMVNLGNQHELINQVVQGDYEEIMDIINTDIEYPCLWIETPDMKVQGDNDYSYPSFIGNVVLLWKADPGNKESVRYAREMSYRVALHIYRRIHQDDDYLEDIGKMDILALPPLTADYLVGWRIQYTKNYKYDPICDEDLGQFFVDVPDKIEFQGSKLFDEGNVITASVIDKPASFTIVEWRYQIDDGAMQSAGNGNGFNINEGGDVIYIELEATTGPGDTVYASLFIGPYVITQKSIPFRYHPINDR